MCEYLFAQWSLKRSTEEGVTAQQLERIRAWESAIEGVVMQEMLHLALATNLLAAVGAAPHFDRPNFPILSGWYPPGVQIALVPFGELALRHFIYLERPEGMVMEDAEGFRALDEAEPLRDGRALSALQQDYATVSQLYHGIEDGFRRLVDRDGEDAVFLGPLRAQARAEAFRWPEIMKVTDLASVGRVVDHIVEQGEGARGDWRTAHFGIFHGILDELRAVRAADPAFEPARDVVAAYIDEPDDADAEVTLITDPFTTEVADLFDAVYETTLQALTRYFVHSTETIAQVTMLARTAKHLMAWGLRPLGIALTTLPIGPNVPGRRAGASFRMVPSTFYYLPFRDAAWDVLLHRLTLIASRAAELASRMPSPELASVAERMVVVRDELHAAMPAPRVAARRR